MIEFCTHGHFYRSPTDQKGVYGAWWIPLRKLVRRVGRDQVEARIAEHLADVQRRANTEIEDIANDSDSSDEEGATQEGGSRVRPILSYPILSYPILGHSVVLS